MIKINSDNFRWHTQTGDKLKLSEMDTRHIFNSMKMLYNHFTLHYSELEPINFTIKHRGFANKALSIPQTMLETLILFIAEIERRSDLPMTFKDNYRRIIHELMGVRKVWADYKGITTGEMKSLSDASS